MRRPIVVNLSGIALMIAATLLLSLVVILIGPFDWQDPVWNPVVLRFEIAATVLAATVVVTRFYDRLPLAWAGIGVHRWTLRELGQGAALGLTIALLAWLATAATGSTRPAAASASHIAYLLVWFVAGAAAEELVFRGYLFQRLIEILGATAATLLVAALFAYAHAGNPHATTLSTINTFLGGVFFALGFIRTGSLWFPLASHVVWNFTLAATGLPVSGIDFGTGLLQTGGAPALIGGGPYGPEAGLATTVAMALGIAALAALPSITLSPYVHARVVRGFLQRTRPS